MEKATVERVNITTVDVRAAGKYIPNAELTSGIKIETIGIGDVVLTEAVDGKYYVIALVSSGGAVPEDKLAAWMPKAPVSLKALKDGSAITFKWGWGDTTRMLPYLDTYVIDVRESGGDWGFGAFPIETGTATTLVFAFAEYEVESIEWRVSARSIYGISSEWAAGGSVDIVLEKWPPPAPDGLAVTPMVGAVFLEWDTPTLEDYPWLGGFNVYSADDTNGTNAALITSVPVTRSVIVEVPYGTRRCYCIRSVSVTGVLSGYDDVGFLSVESLYPPGEQFLTNSDFERDTATPGDPDEWDVSDSSGDYALGAYGWNGGRGIRFSLDNGESGDLEWPLNTSDTSVQRVVEPGVTYVLAIKMKCSDTSWVWNLDDILPMGVTSLNLMPLWWGGTTYVGTLGIGWNVSEGGVEDLGNGWELVWVKIVVHTEGADQFIGVDLLVYNDSGGSITVDFDQAMLGRGIVPEDWVSNLFRIDGTSGMQLDSSGIVASDLVIGADGEIYGDFVVNGDVQPGADDTYWLGDGVNWKGVTVKDGITAPSGASGDAIIFVDTSDSKLKVRHGTATPVSLEEQGTGPIDSNMAVNSSWVSISTSWTTLTSLAITVPTGYRAMVGASVTLRGDSTVSQQIENVRLYDGTSSFQQSDVLAGGTNTVCQIGMTWYTTKTGSYTIYLQGQKATSANTVGADAYRALLTVFIYEEKT